MSYGLESVKAGDAVAVFAGGGWHRTMTKAEVTRTTPARIYIGKDAYTRSYGKLIGVSSVYTRRIEAWTDDHDKSMKAEAIEKRLRDSRYALREFDWMNVTQKQADAVQALLKTFTEAA